MAEKPPSPTADVLGALGRVGCTVALLIFFVPIAGAILYATLGKGSAIAIGVILAGILAGVPLLMRRQAALWRCGRCRQTFQAGLATCPHCGIRVTPPAQARS